MNIITKYVKPKLTRQSKYNRLYDLSVSGELFNKLEVEKIINNIKPSMIYKTQDYITYQYENDNIIIKVLDKVNQKPP